MKRSQYIHELMGFSSQGLYLHFNCDFGIIPILRLFRPTVLVSGGCVFPQEASGDFQITWRLASDLVSLMCLRSYLETLKLHGGLPGILAFLIHADWSPGGF